jgi:hypothetical protein
MNTGSLGYQYMDFVLKSSDGHLVSIPPGAATRWNLFKEIAAMEASTTIEIPVPFNKTELDVWIGIDRAIISILRNDAVNDDPYDIGYHKVCSFFDPVYDYYWLMLSMKNSDNVPEDDKDRLWYYMSAYNAYKSLEQRCKGHTSVCNLIKHYSFCKSIMDSCHMFSDYCGSVLLSGPDEPKYRFIHCIDGFYNEKCPIDYVTARVCDARLMGNRAELYEEQKKLRKLAENVGNVNDYCNLIRGLGEILRYYRSDYRRRRFPGSYGPAYHNSYSVDIFYQLGLSAIQGRYDLRDDPPNQVQRIGRELLEEYTIVGPDKYGTLVSVVTKGNMRRVADMFVELDIAHDIIDIYQEFVRSLDDKSSKKRLNRFYNILQHKV